MRDVGKDAVGTKTARGGTATPEQAALLDVEVVAELLSCSTRHVYRMADAGRMPRPVKLGALVRWRRDELEEWIEHGCPSCRKGGGA